MIARSSISCSPTCPRKRWKALTTAPLTCRGAGSWRGPGRTCFRRDCPTRAYWLSAHRRRLATTRVGGSLSQCPTLSDFQFGRESRMAAGDHLARHNRPDAKTIRMPLALGKHRAGTNLWTSVDAYGAGGIRTHDTIRVHICPQPSVDVRRTKVSATFSATSQSLRSRTSTTACTRTAFRRLPTRAGRSVPIWRTSDLDASRRSRL